VGLHKNGAFKPVDEEKGGGGRGMRVSSQGAYNATSSSDEVESADNSFYAKLLGYNFVPDEFSKDGTRRLLEGNFPENDYECIISKDLLENSGLKVGDLINLTSSLTDTELPFPGEEEDVTDLEISYNLKIVGYYEDLTDEYSEFAKQNEMMQNAYENRRNEIITTINTVIEPMTEGFSGIRVSAEYYLKNPDDLKAFAVELYEKGLGEEWNVETDENSYNTIVKPVLGLKGITFVFLMVVLLLGAIILLLLSTIAIRERKYEIGVLRAMGMKKSRVAAGLLSEVVMITLACLIIGMGSGVITAQWVSDILLDNQIKQIEENNSNNAVFGPGGPVRVGNAAMGMRIGAPGESPAEALKEMDVSLNLFAVLQIIMVALGLAVISSVMGIMHITKYEPIKILSDRT
jgi:putative ABC transport system permease protein